MEELNSLIKELFQSGAINDYFWGISGVRLFFAFFVLLLSFIFKKIFDHFISKKLIHFTEKTSFKYDSILIKALNPPLSAIFILIGFFLSVNILDLPETSYSIRSLSVDVFRVASAVILVWASFRLTDLLALFISDRFSDDNEVIRLQFVPLLNKALRVFVVTVGGLLIVQNLGYSVGSLLAGLGIGGLAVALAAQESLANFFGSIVILSDRPFKVGDWVQVGEVDGDVEEIGFRSTRVRTWSKSLVTIPNKVLANSVIENWSEMPMRRVRQTLQITYDTPVEKVEFFVSGIQKLIQENTEIDQKFYMVRFVEFNNSSLDILVYYFTKSTKWAEHLRVKEGMNLAFMRCAQRLGISFAFPSHSIYWGEGQMPNSKLNPLNEGLSKNKTSTI